MYYDDIEIIEIRPVGSCQFDDGTCLEMDRDSCEALGGVYQGHETLCPPECPADVDGDGQVGFTDLVSILAAWGECAGCPQDLDGDGQVGFTELTVLAAWGPCP